MSASAKSEKKDVDKGSPIGNDILYRNGKTLLFPGYESVKPFVGCVLVLLPIYIFGVIPAIASSLLWIPYYWAKSVFYQTVKYKVKAALPEWGTVKPDNNRKPLDKRSYDLVLFGATGFTGRLAALYLARNYGTKVRWAISGRDRRKLESVRAECAFIDPQLRDLPILIADTTQAHSLKPIVSDTRVAISTAGPFARHGTTLVQQCAVYGTSYCDTTGETDWVRQLVDKFDDVARETGANIVNMCAHDCVPWDLTVMALAKELKSKGEALREVECFDYARGSVSGGTIATIFDALDNRNKFKSKLGFDPLLKTNSSAGTPSESKTLNRIQKILWYNLDINAWVGPFVMAMVMYNCVKRSNALLGYSGSGSLVYKEAMVFSGFMAGFVQLFGLLFGVSICFVKWARYLIQKFVLPKPGTGPSEADMEKGFLLLRVHATGEKGTKLRGSMYFNTDPGYRDTARMLVESGLALALNSDEIKSKGGILTPASCQGKVLLRRLVDTGTLFAIDDIPVEDLPEAQPAKKNLLPHGNSAAEVINKAPPDESTDEKKEDNNQNTSSSSSKKNATQASEATVFKDGGAGGSRSSPVQVSMRSAARSPASHM